MPYSHTIVGNPDDGFTSAEIKNESGIYMGSVFELEDGWHVHVDEPERIRDRELVEAVVVAKSYFREYKARDNESGKRNSIKA